MQIGCRSPGSVDRALHRHHKDVSFIPAGGAIVDEYMFHNTFIVNIVIG